MDFEKLAEILPKPSTTWSVTETQKWIEFTGLHSLAKHFESLGIDGSCLHTLSEDDFRNQLGVTSNIMLKKIMAWVNRGFNEFDEYLKTSRLGATIRAPLGEKRNSKETMKIIEEVSDQPIVEDVVMKRKTTSGARNKNQENQLIIKQCQVQQANFYSFKNKGGMMGRNNSNDISIPDQCVSRFHAEIVFDDGEYYIRDCGSATGTFIRINEKKKLVNGIILEMGSNQFEVSMSDRHLDALKVIEGTNLNFCFILPKLDKITIGRKSHNQIHFPDDHHLSNIHATFFSVDGVWYVQDLGSTNGTWIRLSEEGEKSARWKLQDKAQFKLSTNLTYQCRRNSENRKTEKEKHCEKCIFCKEADQNAMILPCKHNTSCYDCISKLQLNQCQSCGAAIQEVIKIFKV